MSVSINMKRIIVCLVQLTTFFVMTDATERPIIGILAQEVPVKYTGGKTSYLPACYVKAVESSGARVVPIFINRTDEYYRKLLSSINGVLFPGGATTLSDADGYGAAGRKIYDIVLQLQDSGVSFPILGVCQGYELLMYLASNSSAESDVLVDCDSWKMSLPLQFTPEYDKSRLYKLASPDVIEILKTLPVTVNFHRFCITRGTLNTLGLDTDWRVMSTNLDSKGLEFISSSEHFTRPIAGIQFHPEKNMFEWKTSQANPHSRKAVLSARIFYDWLVAESRLNNQSFSTPQEELDALIYNYSPEYTGRHDGFNEQIYYFQQSELQNLSGRSNNIR